MVNSRLLIFLVAMVMGLFSGTLFAKPPAGYYNLSENRTVSENYEIHKLINGAIDAIFHVKATNIVLVMAGGYLWKINDKGYVVDTYRGGYQLQRSGISLWTDSWSNAADEHFWFKRFNDWLYSGDKSEHTLGDAADSSGMSDAQLLAALDAADIVEFFPIPSDGGSERDVALVLSGGVWKLLDISQRLGEIDTRCKEYRRRNKDIWQETCVTGYRKKYDDKLTVLASSLPYRPDWQDKDQPVFLQAFSRDVYYFEDGFGGWLLGATLGKYLKSRGVPGSLPESYWYGTGYFQVLQEGEALKFRAFVAKEKDGINFDNLSIYGFSEEIFAGGVGTKFIEITYRGAEHNYLSKLGDLVKYHEADVGLYVLRARQQPGSHASRGSRNAWRPVYAGMPSRSSVWGDISFYDDLESRHYLLDAAAVPVELHGIPRKLSFNGQVENSRSAFKVSLQNAAPAWYHLRHGDTRVVFDVVFDEAEVRDAFQRLDANGQSMRLEIHMTALTDASAALSVRLSNNSDSITLKRISLESAAPAYHADEDVPKLTRQFEKTRLKIAFNAALKDEDALQEYLDYAGELAVDSLYVKRYAALLDFYAIELINRSTAKGDFPTATSVVKHYLHILLPKIGRLRDTRDLQINVEVLASNSLAVANIIEDDVLKALVINGLLGPAFDVGAITNATLLYNLACHYALAEDKTSLLRAMDLALMKGKAAAKFMADPDFSAYRKDADFLRLLENR